MKYRNKRYKEGILESNVFKAICGVDKCLNENQKGVDKIWTNYIVFYHL